MLRAGRLWDIAIRNAAMEQPPDEVQVPDPPVRQSGRFPCLAILFLAAIAAHLGFSWMGFSPTDEGWILADSRRLLAGQVPHRDFLKVQVPGTLVLHAPEVFFGGDYTFWISRLVAWLQIAVIAWSWPLIFSKLTRKSLTLRQHAALGLIGIAFTANTFPVMVWPTFDGLFFISLGLLLALRPGTRSKLGGYFLIGLSYLCKQNFVFVFPAVLILLRDWKKLRYWTAAILPGILYLGALFVLGALPAAIVQVGSAGGFVSRAIVPYLASGELLLAICAGMTAAALLCRRERAAALLGAVLTYLALLGCAAGLTTDLYRYARLVSFSLMGLCIGATLARLLFKVNGRRAVIAGLVVIAVAWATSISNGFNYPTLAGGILVLFLLQVVLADIGSSFRTKYAIPAGLAVFTIVTLAAFSVGRYHHIYRDLPANMLTAKLDGVLPGGKLLRTNTNTYAFLSDLNLAISETHGARYAIVPGFAAYWVKGKQLNPLPIDWAHCLPSGDHSHAAIVACDVLPNPSMIDRLVKSVADQKGSVVLLVQKVEPEHLRDGFAPLDESLYPAALLSYVRSHFVKVGETKYFELRR